jgi:hypothetical protein
MKSLFFAVCGLLTISLCCLAQPGLAQAPSKGKSGSPDPWASHQMNQPSPEKPRKFGLSQERIDDIRQLYLEAKKELEAKQARPAPRH